MKANITDLNGTSARTAELPMQFEEEYRPDLIRRAFIAIQTSKRSSYGAKPGAGMRYSSKLSRRRRDFKGAYNKGISRVPRKTITRRGMQFNWIGATSPNTVGGRRSHPPKAEKIWKENINVKERRKAIRSALAATINKELVIKRGHKAKNVFPIIMDARIEDVKKTKEIIELLKKLGLKAEIARVSDVKVRSGIGKNRGRRHQNKAGILFIISKDCKLFKSARNIAGCDVAIVNNLNAELLAPGGDAGRLCIWSETAIERLGKEGLFL